MKQVKFGILGLVAMLALPVFAATAIDDLIKLSEGNAGEDVITAWAEKQTNVGSVSVDDILRMKAAKVPDRAIATMIRNGALANAGPRSYIARDEQGNIVTRDEAVRPAPQVTYVQPTSTTYVQPTSYVYDSSPVYYTSYYPYSYGYPRYYYGGYYGGYYRPSFGLSFSFGGGHRYGGYYGGGYHGGYYGGGYGSYRGGSSFRGGSGYTSSFRGGFRR